MLALGRSVTASKAGLVCWTSGTGAACAVPARTSAATRLIAQARMDRLLRVRTVRAGDGSLGVMFDHVGVAVSDLAASERFYRTVLSALGVEPGHADANLVEWEDWCIGPPDREHPVTRGLHVGFRAPSQAAVDSFGGVLLDPDGNSIEAVHGDSVPDSNIDHLRIRVADLAASKRFYATIAPHAGIRLAVDEPGRVEFRGEDFSLALVDDERPRTEHVHLAFPARDNATVRAFHAAALAAGYEDNGGPGERAVYHPGYYGAFVLDPDGHNVEVVNHNYLMAS
jgi:catechol 2,3-dioxygenase-like lactoylglutathione lyase family enzyme